MSDHRKASPQLGLVQTNLGNQDSPQGLVTNFLGNDRPDTFVSAAPWFSPVKQGRRLFPASEDDLWLEDLAPIPSQKLNFLAHLYICCPDVKVHQERTKRKTKRESADRSKDGFEVQPRSGYQEARAVIAAGYQFPFLPPESPQLGAASLAPSESRQD